MIDWGSFLLVAVASLAFTLIIVSTFSLGVRLLTNAQNLVPQAKKGKKNAVQSEALNRIASYMLFAVCFSALIYGIYLVIPGFHK
jgi:hypothetical protein